MLTLQSIMSYCVIKINRVGSPSGAISTEVHNPAVTNSLLKEIWQWKWRALGYDIHTWVAGSYIHFNNLQLLIILL